ncbi:MAG: hypothetical protein E7487_04840 [Ruminococcaceae bacterium]|nr:hypothetical protein [Oscillospiraceae bacterium]
MKHRKLQKRFVAMLLCLAILFSGVVSAGADPTGGGDGVDNALYPTKPIWSQMWPVYEQLWFGNQAAVTAWFWAYNTYPAAGILDTTYFTKGQANSFAAQCTCAECVGSGDPLVLSAADFKYEITENAEIADVIFAETSGWITLEVKQKQFFADTQKVIKGSFWTENGTHKSCVFPFEFTIVNQNVIADADMSWHAVNTQAIDWQPAPAYNLLNHVSITDVGFANYVAAGGSSFTYYGKDEAAKLMYAVTMNVVSGQDGINFAVTNTVDSSVTALYPGAQFKALNFVSIDRTLAGGGELLLGESLYISGADVLYYYSFDGTALTYIGTADTANGESMKVTVPAGGELSSYYVSDTDLREDNTYGADNLWKQLWAQYNSADPLLKAKFYAYTVYPPVSVLTSAHFNPADSNSFVSKCTCSACAASSDPYYLSAADFKYKITENENIADIIFTEDQGWISLEVKQKQFFAAEQKVIKGSFWMENGTHKSFEFPFAFTIENQNLVADGDMSWHAVNTQAIAWQPTPSYNLLTHVSITEAGFANYVAAGGSNFTYYGKDANDNAMYAATVNVISGQNGINFATTTTVDNKVLALHPTAQYKALNFVSIDRTLAGGGELLLGEALYIPNADILYYYSFDGNELTYIGKADITKGEEMKVTIPAGGELVSYYVSDTDLRGNIGADGLNGGYPISSQIAWANWVGSTLTSWFYANTDYPVSEVLGKWWFDLSGEGKEAEPYNVYNPFVCTCHSCQISGAPIALSAADIRWSATEGSEYAELVFEEKNGSLMMGLYSKQYIKEDKLLKGQIWAEKTINGVTHKSKVYNYLFTLVYDEIKSNEELSIQTQVLTNAVNEPIRKSFYFNRDYNIPALSADVIANDIPVFQGVKTTVDNGCKDGPVQEIYLFDYSYSFSADEFVLILDEESARYVDITPYVRNGGIWFDIRPKDPCRDKDIVVKGRFMFCDNNALSSHTSRVYPFEFTLRNRFIADGDLATIREINTPVGDSLVPLVLHDRAHVIKESQFQELYGRRVLLDYEGYFRFDMWTTIGQKGMNFRFDERIDKDLAFKNPDARIYQMNFYSPLTVADTCFLNPQPWGSIFDSRHPGYLGLTEDMKEWIVYVYKFDGEKITYINTVDLRKEGVVFTINPGESLAGGYIISDSELIFQDVGTKGNPSTGGMME